MSLTSASGADAPTPDPILASVQGEWQGTLTYRDYSRPDRLVTLPTRLFAALTGPSELALHFVYDDGPGKTVFAYERLTFDVPHNAVVWSSGPDDASPMQCRVTSQSEQGGERRLSCDERAGAEVHRHTFSLAAGTLQLSKDEIDSAGDSTFRNRYQLTRPRKSN